MTKVADLNSDLLQFANRKIEFRVVFLLYAILKTNNNIVVFLYRILCDAREKNTIEKKQGKESNIASVLALKKISGKFMV